MVARATTALVETLRAVAPGLEPTLLRLVTAGTLWVALGVVVVAETRRQTRDNPREFVARQVLVTFLDQHRPTWRGHVGWLLAVAADRVLVGFGREVLYRCHRERGGERRVFATV